MSRLVGSIISKPHEQQRYETVGDWFLTDHDAIEVIVSELPDWRMELLVGVHELVEAALCKHRKIPEAEVTQFDLNFEHLRETVGVNYPEPGQHPGAPYYKEHAFATAIEKMLAYELGVHWEEYEKAIDSLPAVVR